MDGLWGGLPKYISWSAGLLGEFPEYFHQSDVSRDFRLLSIVHSAVILFHELPCLGSNRNSVKTQVSWRFWANDDCTCNKMLYKNRGTRCQRSNEVMQIYHMDMFISYESSTKTWMNCTAMSSENASATAYATLTPLQFFCLRMVHESTHVREVSEHAHMKYSKMHMYNYNHKNSMVGNHSTTTIAVKLIVASFLFIFVLWMRSCFNHRSFQSRNTVLQQKTALVLLW